MGLGGIYAGIGLAQGLGQAGKEFIDSYQSAQDSARKRKKEDLEIGAMERQEEIRKKRAAIQQDIAGLGTKGAKTAKEMYGLTSDGFDINSVNKENNFEGIEKLVPGVPGGKNELYDSKKYFQESLDGVKNTALEIQKKYAQLASLSESPADAQVYTQMGQQALEDYYSRNYSKLLGQAKGNPEFIDGILEGVTGRKLQVSKDGDAYTIRDENGYIINTIKPNQLGTLTSPEAFKAFVKDSIARDQEKEKLRQELENEKAKLEAQYGYNARLQDDDQAFQLERDKRNNAVNLAIARLQVGEGLDALVKAADNDRIGLKITIKKWDDKAGKDVASVIYGNETQTAQFVNILSTVMANNKDKKMSEQDIYNEAMTEFRKKLEEDNSFGSGVSLDVQPLLKNVNPNAGQITSRL